MGARNKGSWAFSPIADAGCRRSCAWRHHSRLADHGHLHPKLTRHEIVEGMRARKARMAEEADAFVALPGGIGTLEEFMEVWTLNQLGDIEKPAGLFDVNGYYQPFMRFIDHMIAERFLPEAHRGSIVVAPMPHSFSTALSASRR